MDAQVAWDPLGSCSCWHGVTSVVISHDMASTFRIGDRISMLHQGKIIVSGTPQEVLASRHPALREFVETSGLVAPENGDARA